MTDPVEHKASVETLGAYALKALPVEEAERVRRHLEGCAECRSDLDGLLVAVQALPASVEQIEPPPALKLRVMAIVEAEAEPAQEPELPQKSGAEPRQESEAESPQAPGASPDPAATKPRPRWPRLPRWRPAIWVAGAAGAAAVAAVIVVLATGGGQSTRTVEATVAAPLRAAGVRVSVRVHGTGAQLVVNHLPTPPANHVNELWVVHGAASPRPAGTFIVRSGSVEVAGPVRGGDQVLVTVEPGRGTSAPTSTPVIAARV